MRTSLFAAVAVAPLLAVSAASAEVVIGNERTTPVLTSTVNNGASDDVRISSAGSVRPATAANVVAVTVDSNETVTNEGTIEIRNSDGAIGVLLQGGRTGSLVSRGAINIIEDYNQADADNDGDADGPFAQGRNRYGVRVTGASPFVGPIDIQSAGRILVEGNDSFGVSIEAGLTGAFTQNGRVDVLGDRTRAISITGPVTGPVTIGQASAVGAGAIAVDITGGLGGALVLNNGITATGYRFLQRPADVSRLDADDLLQGGPAVRIASSVAGGVIVDAPPPDRSATDPDEDKDGVPDAQETTGVIQSFGSAPAILIAGPGGGIDIGATSTGEAGLLIRGRVGASGLFDGVSSVGVQLGDTGAGAVRIANGLRLTGELNAASANASATGLRLVRGAVAPTIALEGVAQASVTATTTGAAKVVSIEQGASVGTIRNTRRAEARVSGATGDAIVVEDRSGTVTLLENTGALTAAHVVNAGVTVTGRNIAADLSANTSGSTVRQSGVTDGDDGADNVADPDADKDGVDDADEPIILGDVLFGSGADRLEVLNGDLFGGVSFGAGADTLLIDGGARVAGALTDSDGRLTLDVRRGTLELTGGSALRATSLTVGAQSALIVTLNPQTTGALLDIAGPANFAAGSRLGVRLTSLIQGPQRFQVLRSTSLNATGLTNSLEQDTSYLFVSSLAVDQAANSIFVDVRRRTAAEAGLNRAQTGAFDAVYDALGRDAVLRDAFLGRTTREGLLELYDQMLPEHSGGALYALASGGEAISRAIRDRGVRGAGPDGAWVQEFGYFNQREPEDDAGFEARGFGIMGGLETAGLGGALGLSAALLTAQVEEPESGVNESLNATVFEAGLYWRGDFGRLTTSARGAVGYASFDGDRQLVSTALNLDRTASAEWNGLTGSAHAGAAYRADFGRFFVRPEASFDAFTLREGEYEESGGTGFAVAVEERSSNLIAGTGSLTFGGRFGWFTPELTAGWRQIFSGGVGETQARFLGATNGFTVVGADAPEGAALVGFGVSGGSEAAVITFQARAELGDNYEAADVRLNIKFVF